MYENELELGLPHERQFTIACVVSKYREVGQGKSKKIAKRLAAHKMWINIHKNALAKSKANQDLDDDANTEVRNSSNFSVIHWPCFFLSIPYYQSQRFPFWFKIWMNLVQFSNNLRFVIFFGVTYNLSFDSTSHN